MKKYLNELKESLKEIPKMLKREHPYNIYGIKDHIYKNYKQINYFARLCRKSKIDLYAPWAVDYSVTEMTFAMFKDFFERNTKEYSKYQEHWYKDFVEDWHMEKKDAKSASIERSTAYKDIVTIYNYITKVRKQNQDTVDEFQSLVHDFRNSSGDLIYDWNHRKMLWRDFTLTENKDYSIKLKISKKVIDEGKVTREIKDKFFHLDSDLMEIDNKVLHKIIDVMKWMWD